MLTSLGAQLVAGLLALLGGTAHLLVEPLIEAFAPAAAIFRQARLLRRHIEPILPLDRLVQLLDQSRAQAADSLAQYFLGFRSQECRCHGYLNRTRCRASSSCAILRRSSFSSRSSASVFSISRPSRSSVISTTGNLPSASRAVSSAANAFC